MPMTFRASIFAGIQAVGDLAGDLNSTLHYGLAQAPLQRAMEAGAGNYQISKLFADTRTLAASTGEDLDLFAGTLLDPSGVGIVFSAVKGIYVKAAAANANNVQIKPGAATPFLGPFNAAADQITLRPGDVFLATAMLAGWTVSTSVKLLHFHNAAAGTPVNYDVVLIGN